MRKCSMRACAKLATDAQSSTGDPSMITSCAVRNPSLCASAGLATVAVEIPTPAAASKRPIELPVCGIRCSGGLLALFHDDDARLARGRNAVPYLRVANADGEFDRLRRLGVELLDDHVVVEGPLKLFRFIDVDGNMLEIFSVAAERSIAPLP